MSARMLRVLVPVWHPAKEDHARATDDGLAGFGARFKGHAVAENEPEDRDEARNREAVHHRGQHVRGLRQAAVKEREAGDGHHEHEARADEDEGGVAAVGHGDDLRDDILMRGVPLAAHVLQEVDSIAERRQLLWPQPGERFRHRRTGVGHQPTTIFLAKLYTKLFFF